MPSVNDPNNIKDPTPAIYEQFNAQYQGDFPYSIDQDTYDYALSYFLGVCKTRQVAEAFTDNLFRIAGGFQANGENITVQDLLTQIKTSKGITVDTLMAYWLNSVQSSSTLVGVNSPIIPNYWAQRTVLT